MTFEKPWEEEYNRLVRELTSILRGRVEEPKFDAEAFKGHERAYSAEPSYYRYCHFHGLISEVPVHVEISHHDSSLGGYGHLEFLEMSALFSSSGNFRIRPESVIDRVRKALKLHWEYETGDKKFDHEFNIDLPDDRAKPALMIPEVRNLITALLPFEYMHCTAGGIRCSELLTDPGQLGSNYVTNKLKHLATLAGYLRK